MKSKKSIAERIVTWLAEDLYDQDFWTSGAIAIGVAALFFIGKEYWLAIGIVAAFFYSAWLFVWVVYLIFSKIYYKKYFKKTPWTPFVDFIN